LEGDLYVGLFVCSHRSNVVEQAIFRNVRIVRPAKDNFIPYNDYIGSHLEILDVKTGDREIVLSSAQPFEAPNWTLDGNALIYNSSGGDDRFRGRLYRFDLTTKKPAIINTEFAIRNNNDHVLSFDGKMLGLSHQGPEHNNQSAVYTVSAAGGTPKQITPMFPSYLHGWSPDAKFLVFTGVRNGKTDIFRINSNGGDEMRLTDAKGVNDGPEYTPDGKYIYFNSSRSGVMQIWRMKPDGKDQEQVTHDGLNNWFPHISPDGKWIAFVSYMSDVAPGDHPYYKHVYLRLMPIEGGTPRVIAYLYGGQGTMNVPSWSPDNKRVAFVSNSDME
jgi:Tol biopolymer transport system component